MNPPAPQQLQPQQQPNSTQQPVQPDWVYEKSTGWLYLLLVIILALSPLFPFNWVLGIYAAVATYQDLRRWGRSTTGWTIAVAVFGGFAYVFYVHKRPRAPQVVSPMPSAATVAPLPTASATAPTMPPTSAQAPAQAETPAAWYSDPLGKARVRWWDGAAWTDHTSD